MKLGAERFGCFGKLPVSREFLVDGASELSRSGFDAFLGEGLGLAKMQMGNTRFRELALGFPALRFVWSMPEGKRAAVGLLVPSEDAAGRIHPFSVFAWVERGESAPDDPLHPLSMLPLHGYLDELLARCRAAAEPGTVLQAVRSSSLDVAIDPSADYRSFLSSRTLGEHFGELESALSVPGIRGTLRDQLVQALHESVSYLRGRPPIDIRLGLRCPLVSTATLTVQVSVWIDLIRRIFGSAVPGPCSFWTRPGSEGGSGALHFFFSRPSNAQWMSLIDPGIDLETVSAIERPYGGDPRDRMDGSLRAVLTEDGATLGALLGAFR